MKKKYLLLTTVGNSNHWKTWLQVNRNYDIGLIYYENNNNYTEQESEADFFWHRLGFKYPTLYSILEENPQLLEYEYIWMPDDDIEIRDNTINNLFELASKYNLDMAQPSIIPKNYTWPVTVHQEGTILRYCSMVEIMCPMFKGSILKELHHTLKVSKTGWGLEGIWSKLLGWPKDKIAVIDSILVEHVKKLNTHNGELYKKMRRETKYRDPKQEMNALLKKYETKIFFKEYGNIRY